MDEKDSDEGGNGKWSILDLFRGESIVGTVFTQVNAIIGCGIVFLPYIMKDLGLITGLISLITGILVIVFSLFLTYFALNAARKKLGEERKVRSVDMLIKVSFENEIVGHIIYFSTKFVGFILLSGCVISFQIVQHDLLQELLRLSLKNDFYVKSNFYSRLIAGSAVGFGLCVFSTIKRIRNMSFISMISVTSLVILFLTMFILLVTGFTQPMRSGTVSLFIEIDGLGSFFRIIKYGGILTFTNLNGTIPRLHSEFSLKNVRKLPIIIIISYLCVFLLYFSSACIGYLSFLDNAQINILFSYDGEEPLQYAIAIFFRALMFCNIFFTYPIIAFVHTQTLYELVEMVLMKKKKKEEEDFDEDTSDPDTSTSATETTDTSSEEEEEPMITSSVLETLGIDRKYLIFTFMTILSTVTVTTISIFYPNADRVMNYVGGIPGILLIIILPTISYLKLVKPPLWFSLVAGFVALMSFLIIGFGSLVVQILEEIGWLDEM